MCTLWDSAVDGVTLTHTVIFGPCGSSGSFVDFFSKYDFIFTTIILDEAILYACIITSVGFGTLISVLHFIPKIWQDDYYKTKSSDFITLSFCSKPPMTPFFLFY